MQKLPILDYVYKCLPEQITTRKKYVKDGEHMEIVIGFLVMSLYKFMPPAVKI